MTGRRWKFKQTEEQKCKKKLRHTDYWSALLHARQLGVDPIDIYPCDCCGGLHLGHTKLRYAAHVEREGKSKVATLRKRIARHQRIASEHARIAKRLECQLEAALIVYDAESLTRPVEDRGKQKEIPSICERPPGEVTNQ